MPDPGAASPVAADAAPRRFLTFRAGERLYALPAGEVAEVIRMPPVARVPQAPPGLLGLANLRGNVLPVASLRGLLGRPADGPAAARAIVLDGAAPAALAVDAVEALVAVPPERVETRPAALAAEPGERLRAAFPAGSGGEVALVLDIASLLGAAFAPRPRAAPVAGAARPAPHAAAAPDRASMLVSFEVAGQEYALALDAVREIAPAPAALPGTMLQGTLAVLPRADAPVLGVTAFRGALLPLLSLRGLLGFPPRAKADGREKLVVAVVAGVPVGLVADRVRAIVAADPDLLEPVPPALAARFRGEARVASIYRGEGGRRLISVLAPEQLFREDVMQRLDMQHPGASSGTAAPEAALRAAEEERPFLAFRLGGEEFALPVSVIDEVARVPERITRLPRTPAFLEGVANLRGEVLPVIDQRRRFGLAPAEGAGRRLVVVRTERHRAGLIVDSVSEVLRAAPDAIAPAPDIAGEAARLVEGVINLEGAGRIVLLLDPAELLSRAERALLDAFAAEAPAGAEALAGPAQAGP